jgi:hypothetical protein
MMAAMTNEETIPVLLRNALIDRMEAWELVEFLGIIVEDILEDYEREIVDNMDELEELMGITNDTGEE